MSRPGGRGYVPRGSSYRGRGSDGNWNSRGRGGSFSGPSRGRFNYYNSSSGFESRKYSGNSSGERYSSRGRGGEDSGYRRYQRPDSSYSGRDHGHHRSPESSRKRLRTESYGSQASSSRRSHEGSYGGGAGGGGDFNDRYNYSEEKGSGYADRSYRDRSANFRDRSREEFTQRKVEQTMPPPSSPRHIPSRGTYRGRMPYRGSRGISRILQSRRNDALVARKSFPDGYIRKRVFASKVSADTWRRMKLQKLRSRLSFPKKIDKKQKDDDAASNDDEEEEEDDDADVDVEKPDDELEEGETVEPKESPKKKIKKEVVEEEREEGEEIDDDDDEEEEDEGKDQVEGDGGVQITIKQDSDTRDVSEDGRKRPKTSSGYMRHSHFIRLSCPHCLYRCVTFKEYMLHLHSVKHVSAMRRQSLQHKQKLISMRVSQRQEQRLLEESEETDGLLAPYSSFCHICKLNFRQHKSRHFASKSHLSMKTFLMPYCRVCRLTFKSPMLYENHICSLEHIKLKARIEERMQQLKSEANESASEDDSDEKDADKYVTLDSVGIVDAEGVELDEDADISKDDEKEKTAVEENPGAEYLRKVEVYFCELCRLYLPRADVPERSIAKHCNSSNHLQKYIRHRRDKVLRKKAELFHQKDRAERKAKAKKLAEAKRALKTGNGAEELNDTSKSATEETVGNGEKVTATASATDADLIDESTWADVDKDLGDLLENAMPDKKRSPDRKGSSDEDDEGASGRYDRFGRSSQKEPSAEPGLESKEVVENEQKGDALQVKVEIEAEVESESAPENTVSNNL